MCGSDPIYILYSSDATWSATGNFSNGTGSVRYFSSSIKDVNNITTTLQYSYNLPSAYGNDGAFASFGTTGGAAISYGDSDCAVTPSIFALPIELVDFDVVAFENSIFCAWQTMSEDNNDYFTLQWDKSNNNENLFESVKQIDGAGNSNELISYETKLTDVSPGLYYLRIQQTDFNGRTTTFPPKSIFVSGKNFDLIGSNQVDDVLTLSFNQPLTEEMQVKCFNSLGQELGLEYTMNAHDFQLVIKNLPQGISFLKMLDKKGETMSFPLMVR
jgi:hypothetical protein